MNPVGTKPRYLGMRGVHTDPPKRFTDWTYVDFGVPVFRGLLCERCRAGLWNEHGQPRWDFTARAGFTCSGRCRIGGER